MNSWRAMNNNNTKPVSSNFDAIETPRTQGDTSRLPADFSPSPYSVLIGRGKICSEAVGTRRLKVIASRYLDEYSNARSRLEKSAVVTQIVDIIQEACPNGGAFVKFENGYWREVSDSIARDKVGGILRDAIHEQYKSGSNSKLGIRRKRTKMNMFPDTSFSATALPPTISALASAGAAPNALQSMNFNFSEDAAVQGRSQPTNTGLFHPDLINSMAVPNTSSSRLLDVYQKSFVFDDVLPSARMPSYEEARVAQEALMNLGNPIGETSKAAASPVRPHPSDERFSYYNKNRYDSHVSAAHDYMLERTNSDHLGHTTRHEPTESSPTNESCHNSFLSYPEKRSTISSREEEDTSASGEDAALLPPQLPEPSPKEDTMYPFKHSFNFD